MPPSESSTATTTTTTGRSTRKTKGGATWSARVLALAGVPSVAEAAALAACGPKARLILPRIVVGKVTCALAESGEAP